LKQFTDAQSFKRWLTDTFFGLTYEHGDGHGGVNPSGCRIRERPAFADSDSGRWRSNGGREMIDVFFEKLRAIAASVEDAQRSLAVLDKWLWETIVARDVWPQELPAGAAAPLQQLESELAKIQEAQREAFEYYFAGLVQRWFKAKPLTREEYHLVAACVGSFMTAKQLGLSEIDDYDVYSLLCYEDDTCWCYIDPFARPRDPSSGTVGLRVGRPPEELKASALRPEQREFFARYFPEALARFQA
jgi:hypothetical protein